MKKWPDNRVASLKADSLVVFYYLSASEIWPDKSGSLQWAWPDKSGSLQWEWPDKSGSLQWEWPDKQSVPKTFQQTSPNSILEEFFFFD